LPEDYNFSNFERNFGVPNRFRKNFLLTLQNPYRILTTFSSR
jgi:hypothetical protein